MSDSVELSGPVRVRVKPPKRRHCEYCGAAVSPKHTGPTSCCDGGACWGGNQHYGGVTHDFEYGDAVVEACCVFVAEAARAKVTS